MTLPATSGPQLSMFEERLKMPPPTGLGGTLVVRRFAWPNQLVGFLFLLYVRAICEPERLTVGLLIGRRIVGLLTNSAETIHSLTFNINIQMTKCQLSECKFISFFPSYAFAVRFTPQQKSGC